MKISEPAEGIQMTITHWLSARIDVRDIWFQRTGGFLVREPIYRAALNSHRSALHKCFLGHRVNYDLARNASGSL